MHCATCDTVLPRARPDLVNSAPTRVASGINERRRKTRAVTRGSARQTWSRQRAASWAASTSTPRVANRPNEIVRAVRYYTRADDGLSAARPWHGRMWLNPPYDNLAPKFFRRFCEEHAAGHVPMACLLLGTHHLTTKWFQKTRDFAAILCFPAGRLRFTGYQTKTQPMHGSVILGAGVDPELFRREFSAFGTIADMGTPE